MVLDPARSKPLLGMELHSAQILRSLPITARDAIEASSVLGKSQHMRSPVVEKGSDGISVNPSKFKSQYSVEV